MTNKELLVDLEKERYLLGFYKYLITQLELPINTGFSLDGISDFMREPWEEDKMVRFINYSKASKDVKTFIDELLRVFERVKTFQKRCGNNFTWTIED